MSGFSTPALMSSPRVPDESPGSSISSNMQNEYEELLKYSVVVPQFDPKQAPCVLENAMGLFITPSLQLQIQKSNEHVQKCKSKQNSPVKQVPITNTQKQTEIKIEVKEPEIIKSDSFINTTLDSLSHHDGQTDNESLSFSPEMLRVKSQNQRSRQRHQSNTHTNDINPRKHSPVPISPPTNLEFEQTIDKSIETILNNHQQQQNQQHNPSNQMDDNLKIMNQINQKNLFDKLFKEFKGQVMTEFEKSRLQLMQEQQKLLIEEKEKQSIEIKNLQKEIEIMKKNIVDYDKNLEKKDDVIANLSKALEKQREKSELQKAMMEWKFKKIETSREVFTTKLAEKFYQLKMKSKIFLNWHILLANKHKNKVEKACKKKAEEVCLDLAKQYEDKIKKLEEELQQANEQLSKFKEDMSKYEDNMRKALMRGVCALNLEAMSIFDGEKKPLNSHNDGKISYYSDEDLRAKTNQSSVNDKTIIVDEDPTEQQPTIKKVQFRPSAFKKVNENVDIDILNKVKEHCELKYSSEQTANQVQKTPTIKLNQAPIETTLNRQVLNELNEHDNLVKSQIRNSATKAQPPRPKTASSFPYRNIVIEKHTKSGTDQLEINRITQPKQSPSAATNSNLLAKKSLNNSASKQKVNLIKY